MQIKVPRSGGVVEETSVVPTKARGTAGFMGEMDVPGLWGDWLRGEVDSRLGNEPGDDEAEWSEDLKGGVICCSDRGTLRGSEPDRERAQSTARANGGVTPQVMSDND